MKKKISLRTLTAFMVINLGILGALVVFAQTSSFNFDRNLTIGSRGTDVLELQKTLNLRPETRLASSGPGSRGEETTYFGPITRSAVIKYQELYTAEVLTPVGLARGTGFFGPSTRKHIHNNQTTNQTTSKGPEEEVVATTQAESSEEVITPENIPQQLNPSILGLSFFGVHKEGDAPTLFFPSHYDGLVGNAISIQGLGLSGSDLKIYFGNTLLSGSLSRSETQISFRVPEVSPGRYNIFVSNTKGISSPISFNVLKKGAIPPSIDRISPEFGFGRTTVTIFGSNFTRTGNTIYTGFDERENVLSPDGKTITISLLPPNLSGDTSGLDIASHVPVFESDVPATLVSDTPEKFHIYVENINGLSNDSVYTYFYDKENLDE